MSLARMAEAKLVARLLAARTKMKADSLHAVRVSGETAKGVWGGGGQR
jgi:hypothetical protein